MADDEGRMLDPAEARVRRRIASITRKDIPKPFLAISRDVDQTKETRKQTRDFDKANPTRTRRYSGTAGIKVRGEPQNVVGIELRYRPSTKTLKVPEVYPLKQGPKTFGFEKTLPEQHQEIGGKMLPIPVVKDLVKKAAVSFPKADELTGSRITGAHKQAAEKAVATGMPNLIEEVGSKMQKFNLEGVRRRLGKLGKAGKVLGLGLATYDVLRNLNKE